MNLSSLDVLLLLIFYNENHQVRGAIRLIKLLFLLLFEGGLKEYLEEFGFEGYNYGPWSAPTFDYIELVQDEGLVIVETITVPTFESDFCQPDVEEVLSDFEKDRENEMRIYNLSKDGLIVAKHLNDLLSNEEQERFKKIINKYAHLTQREILEFVYNNYKEFTANSIIKDKIPVLSAKEEFKQAYPDATIDQEFFKVVGILPQISLEEEKKKIRKIACQRF